MIRILNNMDDNRKSALICRVCMKTDGLLLSMFDGDISYKQLAKKLAIIASIEVEKNDDLPNVLCTKCAYRTDAYYNFRCQVHKSEQQLRKMMKMQRTSLTTLESDNEIVQTKENLKAQYYNYDVEESGINDILPRVLINTNDVSLSSDKINNDAIKIINTRIIDSNYHDEFTFFNDKSVENIEKCLLLSSTEENEHSDLKNGGENQHSKFKNGRENQNSNLKNGEENQNSDLKNGEKNQNLNLKNGEKNQNSNSKNGEKNKNLDLKNGEENQHLDLKNGEKIQNSALKNHEKNNNLTSTEQNTFPVNLKAEEKNFNHETNENSEEAHETDDCIDNTDNLLGSLNDTIVRIKEIKLADGKLKYQCTLCMHNYNELPEILIHTVDNHIPKSGPFYCVVCEKDCENQRELRSHVKCHTGSNPYTCFICNKAYSMKRYLKRHMTCHTDFARYRCTKCGERFKIKAELENHVKKHFDGFACDQCNKVFNYKSSYKRHLIMHLDPDGVSLPKYPCCICAKRFVNNRTLKIHMRVHTGEKPFLCEICNKTFSQQGNLLNHMKIHSEPRRYTCDVCGKRFNQRSTLKDHNLLHTGEKPYVCSVCGLAFTFGAALRRHSWTHADDKPLGCDNCNARFVGKYELKRHMKVHWDKSKKKRKKNNNKIECNGDIVVEMDDCRVEEDIVLTQVTESVPETIFIEHVLIDPSSENQIVISSREDSEKENVDALFHLIEF